MTERSIEMPLTLLAEGLLKNGFVKAAEGGTEIFKFREHELLVSVGHVVLGLGLLEAQGLGHGFGMTGHLVGRKDNYKVKGKKVKKCHCESSSTPAY